MCTRHAPARSHTPVPTLMRTHTRHLHARTRRPLFPGGGSCRLDIRKSESENQKRKYNSLICGKLRRDGGVGERQEYPRAARYEELCGWSPHHPAAPFSPSTEGQEGEGER